MPPYGCGCAVSRSGTAQLGPIVNFYKIDFGFFIFNYIFLKIFINFLLLQNPSQKLHDLNLMYIFSRILRDRYF